MKAQTFSTFIQVTCAFTWTAGVILVPRHWSSYTGIDRFPLVFLAIATVMAMPTFILAWKHQRQGGQS